MGDELILGDEDLRNLHRHYINLTCIDSGEAARAGNAGKPKRYNFSAFVAEVEGVALAITAGHVFSYLRKAVQAGAVLSDWAVDDSMVDDHGHPAYPVSLDLERDVIYFDEDGLDYGAYLLDPMALRALEKSGIAPVRENEWDADDLNEFPFWTLVGVPLEFSELPHSGRGVKNHVSVHIVPLEERPIGLTDTKHPRLYARVDFESVAERGDRFDIGGMSGGPIFGTQEPPVGRDYDYRLIGIQSGWDNQENVSMCPAQPFLRALALRAKPKVKQR